MKTLLFILLSTLFIKYAYSQDAVLKRVKPSKIDAIVDSLRKELREDSIRSSMFYISSDRFEMNAYGCLLYYQKDSVTGYKLLFQNDTLKKLLLNQKEFKDAYRLLYNAFVDPMGIFIEFP
ncbi:MAG: hypothetical protein HYX40_00105 [Sphingobacteriales bacterium]|nr:hypothetical protein [Sphingobacteriales bacterium]